MYILFSISDGPGFSKAGFLGFGTGGLETNFWLFFSKHVLLSFKPQVIQRPHPKLKLRLDVIYMKKILCSVQL